jgi:hypothetical protein
MLLLMVRGCKWMRIIPITLTITDLIINARKEMILATDRGDRKLELFWAGAMDRFLDTYARESVTSSENGS